MPSKAKEDPRLKRLSALCLRLPEAVREDKGNHAAFLVRKKTFVYFLNDHHGDGIVSLCCKVLPGDNTALIASDPVRFYMPAYIGSRGWVAFRLDTPAVEWDEVGELVTGSYQLVAPKKLAAMQSRLS
jgi:hypothetical protein